MRRCVLCSVAVILGSVTTLAAQSSSASIRTRSKDFAIVTSSNCPVNMRALQGSGYGLVQVRNNQQPGPSERPPMNLDQPAQRIHLILAIGTSPAVSAKIEVRGLSPRSRAKNVSDATGASDLSKALDVEFAPEDSKSVAADLLLPGFTSVSSIEVVSVTYQDGSIWRVADHTACRVAPDPVMLVAGP
jgi:hypothetical protein